MTGATWRPLLDWRRLNPCRLPAPDGQVLVYHDLLGINDQFKPKFVKRYAELRGEMVDAVAAYAEEVRTRVFPGPEHAYGVAPEEMERLKEMVASRAHA